MSERRLAAIMFTDIVGYTALMGKDEGKAFDMLSRNRAIHETQIRLYNGVLIKDIGDAILASFSLASDAVRCAIEIQKSCKKENIPLKIGIHEGEVVFTGTDVFGDGVNIASRIQDNTTEGCISISGAVYRDIKNKADIETRFIGERRFKNVDELVKVYEVFCEGMTAEVRLKKSGRSHYAVKFIRNLPFKKVLATIITILVVVAVALFYPGIFNKDKFEGIRNPDGKISVAVMPFTYSSIDTQNIYLKRACQVILISALSNSEELSVKQYEVMNTMFEGKGIYTEASITPSIANDIALKLKAKTYILGTIFIEGNQIRLDAQLINTEKNEVYKSFVVEGGSGDALALADSLSVRVKNYLEIKKIVEQYNSPVFHGPYFTNSSEAFNYYMNGYDALLAMQLNQARDWFLKTIEIDSGLIRAYVNLALTYGILGNDTLAKEYFIKAYKKREELPIREKLLLDFYHAYYFETPNEEIYYLDQILEIDELNPGFWFLLGRAYYKLAQYEKAIFYWEKVLEIHKSWGVDYRNVYYYWWLGESYHKANNHKKEKEIFTVGLRLFPDRGSRLRIIGYQAICMLSQNDTDLANKLITNFESLGKEVWSDSELLANLGLIYSEAGLFVDAEKYYRQALRKDPNNPNRMYNLAWFLIKYDINFEEGMKLNQQAIELKPETWDYLDAKAWGLYMEGNYEKALIVLNDAWDLRPSAYFHEGYIHKQAIEKALASQPP